MACDRCRINEVFITRDPLKETSVKYIPDTIENTTETNWENVKMCCNFINCNQNHTALYIKNYMK